MKKKRILLVDDEVGFTRLLKLNLEQRADYEVRVENWAEKALHAAREFRPDLVLLDVIMPHMIGNDVAACMREDATLKGTPIVFLSAVGGRKSPSRTWNSSFSKAGMRGLSKAGRSRIRQLGTAKPT